MKLIWFRHDLRVADNSALHAACTGETPVTALYVLSDIQWQRHTWAPMKRAFLREHLASLATSLSALGIPLKLLRSQRIVGQADEVLAFAQAHAVSDIYINDEYGVHEQDRDQRLLQGGNKLGISIHRYCDHVLLPPGTVLTSANQQPYTVYTPFKRACEARLPAKLGVLPPPAKQPSNPLGADPLPEHFTGEASFDRNAWPVGEQAAMRRLLQFCKTGVRDYRDERDRPDHAGTSRLSPYLMLGVLSPRQVWQAAAAVPGEGSAGFRNEILWREFYQHLMGQIPRLSKAKPFKLDTDQLPWSHDAVAFQRWCDGETGIPIVDAAMRCLNDTGWMHNRLRMIVASFLTKNLFIDWRWGERYFLEKLIDGEFAANNGGWQWSASTGTDAAPYFRVFNPETQAQRFDPDGVFIRTWIPELSKESARTVHVAGKRGSYPAPMVDLKLSRARAIGHFQNLAGKPVSLDQHELAL